jgi:hypothetical protein
MNFQPFLAEQIGYRTAGRGTVIAVLGGFCLCLIGAGVALQRRQRLEHLGWIGPGAAGVSAALLAGIGISLQREVPPTLAVAQFVEAPAESAEVGVSGLMALYEPEAAPLPAAARRGGIFRPVKPREIGGITRRMVWTDLDAWHWENLTVPQGVWLSSFESASPLSRPVAARARFGAAGLTGTLTAGLFEELSDAVVATPAGRSMSVEWGPDGTFQAPNGNLLTPGQYVAGSLLSSAQHRRQAVYQQLLADGRRQGYPRRPMLFAWARPLDTKFSLADEAQRLGSALVAVELEMEQTPPGSDVALSAAFLPYTSARSPRDGAVTGIYDNRTGEWHESGTPCEAWLRFQLPPEVLPLQVAQAALSVRATGPARRIEVFGRAGQQLVSLGSRNNPIGTLRFEIDRGDVLQLDSQGGLVLAVAIGDLHAQRDDSSDPSYEGERWRIEALSLELTGRTLEP